jgi:phenol 2-monooxygenase
MAHPRVRWLRSAKNILSNFPAGTVELVVLHPFPERSFEWADIPNIPKRNCRGELPGPASDTLYGTYGVNPEIGAAVTVRPDGYVGMVSTLLNVFEVESDLSHCLVRT